MTELYTRKGQTPEISKLVRVSNRQDGTVRFASAWGGFVHLASEAEFGESFVKLDADVAAKLFQTFTPINVTALEGEVFMPGFVNGEQWNGWEVPRFTTDAVLEALNEGGHLSHPQVADNVRYHFDETTETLYELEAKDGGTIPENFDISPLIDLLANPVDMRKVKELGDVMGYRITRADKTMIIVEGREEPVVVHEVGNGWCWENMERFEKDVRPGSQIAPGR